MVFGFDRATDEKSMSLFLQRLADPEMVDILIPRLDDGEINTILDLFTGLMKKHLSKDEYHRLFLGENPK
ncbi:MAG: hypothetical protein ABFQ82_05710 [Thermodesulfobacteriota bacterium]